MSYDRAGRAGLVSAVSGRAYASSCSAGEREGREEENLHDRVKGSLVPL